MSLAAVRVITRVAGHRSLAARVSFEWECQPPPAGAPHSKSRPAPGRPARGDRGRQRRLDIPNAHATHTNTATRSSDPQYTTCRCAALVFFKSRRICRDIQSSPLPSRAVGECRERQAAGRGCLPPAVMAVTGETWAASAFILTPRADASCPVWPTPTPTPWSRRLVPAPRAGPPHPNLCGSLKPSLARSRRRTHAAQPWVHWRTSGTLPPGHSRGRRLDRRRPRADAEAQQALPVMRAADAHARS